MKLEQLRNPTLDSLRASIQIQAGRVQVNPFTVRVGSRSCGVAGSHGIDQSLEYTLGLRVPRSDLGAGANQRSPGLSRAPGKRGSICRRPTRSGSTIKVGGP